MNVDELLEVSPPPTHRLCATGRTDSLRQTMWEKLDLVRVYTKPKGHQPDYSSPVVLKRARSTVEDFCMAIHKDIAKQMKYSVVWGTSVKHSRGQKVGLDHTLHDEDVICIVKS